MNREELVGKYFYDKGTLGERYIYVKGIFGQECVKAVSIHYFNDGEKVIDSDCIANCDGLTNEITKEKFSQALHQTFTDICCDANIS